MSERYLWDRSGPADPELEKLERLLAPLRFERRHAPAVRQPPWRAALAAAALILVAVALLVQHRLASPGPQWRIAGGPLLADGATLRPSERVTIASDAVGEVEIEPGSELRVAKTLELPRGTIHARIWAPPRIFVVDTPSARAIDLGCQYTLSVDERGNGRLRVETGWVAFQHGGREAFIPAGAACTTSRERGPATPYYEDAAPEFTDALGRFDRSGDREALKTVLARARTRDALTLWHLLTEDAAVFERFAQLVKVPAGVTRERVLAKNRAALDACWNALGLEDADWWRGWERDWRP